MNSPKTGWRNSRVSNAYPRGHKDVTPIGKNNSMQTPEKVTKPVEVSNTMGESRNNREELQEYAKESYAQPQAIMSEGI
ncbi:hypothetical protein KY290_005359 [Solanum tuberosum]|uniref:Uncharacterized protein n=1 Tax=Solanum tuberosum TaxID=4113 RepID=A0ABQ7WDY8_SOLTU|nr:hypothetical protein KY284_005457 [Solanum tuberosum]KAH0722707.1 hypothetical protein KY289_005751 [Solanum tuberosum]KAH0752081.1 hypothetical protein KY285_005229 [Solanum tuberosum]KAH0778932.1 hypothetical protein KY290_005359 [Solanum tuberosum]